MTEDAAFIGSIPKIYERLLVPLVFAEPTGELATAILATRPGEILETAAGTGILTRALVDRGATDVLATDLNQAMLDEAAELCRSPHVRWRVADALDLPLPDDAVDAVACQFGVMFFPDRPRGYAEARRVLRPGRRFFFNTWNRLEANPAWRIVSDALNAASAGVPVEFLRRTPFAYFEPEVIERDLRAAGFDTVTIETLGGTSVSTPEETAIAVCQGTPLRGELVAHPTLGLEQAIAIAIDALRGEYGDGSFTAPISWLQVSAS